MISPTIKPEYVDWSIKIVQNDIRVLSSKFEAGIIGANSLELRQSLELVRIVKEYLIKDFGYVNIYLNDHLSNQKMHFEKIIPYTYLHKRLSNNVAFKNDRIGATSAIKKSIQTMLERDIVREMPKLQLVSKFNTTQRCFVVSDPKVLG